MVEMKNTTKEETMTCESCEANIKHTHPETLPFFVYGTLRPGQGLHRSWLHDCVAFHDGLTFAHGYKLVGADHPFPYAVATDDPCDVTTGALIIPSPGEGRYEQVRRRFDDIEGYPSHYDRVEITVNTPYGPRQAWIYTPDMADPFTAARLSRMADVPGNDWTLWMSNQAEGGWFG
jgi:gamma-glutamylcyclotransferase (GGCT)/AIG2-like uncharacterized protein YtfP